MKSLYGIKAWFYFPLMLLMAATGSLADETNYFQCGTAVDSVGAYVENPAIHREAVAVYGCKNTGDSTLPSWWQTIWGTNNRPGVYTYFKDNSRNEYSVAAHPYGNGSTYAYTSLFDPGTGESPDLSFIENVLWQLDQDIDMAALDDNPVDGIVDAAFFFVVNDTNTVPDGHYFGGSGSLYQSTTDQNIYGQYITVDRSRTVWIRAQSAEAATAVAVHEWGHVLGLPEQKGGAAFKGLGGFSVMGTGFPGKRAVPVDPWSLQKLGWDSTIEVTAPLYGKEMPDYLTTGVIYKLPKNANEYFLVTNHRGTNPEGGGAFWEQYFKGFGPLIWHVDKTAPESVLEFSHKAVDLELAQGLYASTDSCGLSSGSPNASTGRDSLDLKAGCGFPDSSQQSPACFWNAVTQKLTFDGLSNPSTAGYIDSVDAYGVRKQTVVTHLGVRNIQTQSGPGYSATADLLVNNWYGHLSANTTWGPGMYAITGDITVDSGVTLTIEPGTTIKFQKNEDNQSSGGYSTKSELIVKGTLACVGAVDDSIIFTSSASSPSNTDWGGVVVLFPGRANVEFTRFSYADTALAVRGDTATVYVYNSTFTNFDKAAVSSRSAKTRLGGIVPIPNPPDCGRNNFLMSTATSGAKAVIKTTTPGGTLKAEGNWWSQAPPESSWFSGNNVDRTPYLLDEATPDSCNDEAFSEPPPGEKVVARPSIPTHFDLGQNYPNPFNPTATIQYALPVPARVELKIFNILGQVVRTLVDEEKPVGYHQVVWDGKDQTGQAVSSGIYLYQIKAGDFVETKKMQLVK